MLSTFSVTNNCRCDIYNNEGILSRNWREWKHSANNLYLKKKEPAKTLITRFSIKHVQQVLLVLVSNGLHMSFV